MHRRDFGSLRRFGRVMLIAGCAIGSPAALSACGGNASGSAGGGGSAGADAGNGGAGGAGGHSGGAGGSGSGGVLGGAGGAVCGLCPAIACAEGVRLSITPNVDAGASVLANLSVTANGLTFDCTASSSPCEWFCNSIGPIPDGDYVITVSAPGFEPGTVDVHAVTPTDCGCCGCCPFQTFQALTLEPNGSSVTGCCANLQEDARNCGTCGRACDSGSTCAAGKCTPAAEGCLKAAAGVTTCEAYCKGGGEACVEGCGANDATGALEWAGTDACSGAYQNRTCSDVFDASASYACCCGDP